MNIAFYTLGCKVNQYETEVMRELFIKNGHSIVNADLNPDVFILNSCTVTSESDRKTRQLVRKYRKLLPHSVIALTGCMPQAFPEDAEALDAADVIIGNRNPALLLKAVDSYLKDGQRVFSVNAHEKGETFAQSSIARFSERTRAYLKIEDGCDRFCSYCIIPTARGRVRSKPINEIKKEAAVLAESGYKEIVLVGINLSAYGKELDGVKLCDAVEAVCEIPPIIRVRLGSLEPDQIDDDSLNRLALLENFCPQFHLSLQSGSDNVLKRMNRQYDTAYYCDFVSRIRNRFENASFTTDIMVGFPGETEEEFMESANFIKKIGFAKCHVFAYSVRKGTAAAQFPNQILRKEKERRSKIMQEWAATSGSEFLNSQIGQIVSVLFETVENCIVSGYTTNYLPVKVNGDSSLCGQIRCVEMTHQKNGVLFGILHNL